ncbi:hypothetical protein [Rhodoferax sp.]|uniref:hypothetical protein n=1 Tax=Rhodoferax sp. TaxID=50421 RepID=UPI0025DF46CD|nr:hypothetical protein [Rhodoferax sp.]MCM2342102.1 hypothetical protein [Rhodoferax sp.]
MTDQTPMGQPAAWAKQTGILVQGLQDYRDALDMLPREQCRSLIEMPKLHRHLTYMTPLDGWGTVAETHLGYMLTNEVNRLGQSLQKLTAWASILKRVDIEVKHELLYEFVNPLAELALNLPFAIKNRFAFAAMRLSDEANQLTQNSYSLEKTSDDTEAPHRWNDFWTYSRPWNGCSAVKTAVEGILPDSKNRNGPIETHRDRYAHRIPRYIGLGILESALVEWQEHRWTVSISELPPIDLDGIVATLTPCHQACLDAHAKLCMLAAEQWQHIQTQAKNQYE